ncbi:MAG: DUF5683 domain-containing protein, partial [Bacteroidota bacterium]
MHIITRIFFLITLLALGHTALAQKDSTAKKQQKKNTNIFSKPDPNKKYNPNIALYRSAILPGWGQVTNKKYWKVPIIYAALGITTVVFFHDVKQYRGARD